MARITTVLVPILAAGLMASIIPIIAGCDKNVGHVDRDKDRTDQQAAPHDNSAARFAAASVNPRPYPLDVCLVSGEKLGSMGQPLLVNFHGQQLGFCCQGCMNKFNAEPGKYLPKLTAALNRPADPKLQRLLAEYPLTTCVVMAGEDLGPQAVNYMHGERLVRFCCPECIDRFKQAPERYLAMIDAAAGAGAQ